MPDTETAEKTLNRSDFIRQQPAILAVMSAMSRLVLVVHVERGERLRISSARAWRRPENGPPWRRRSKMRKEYELREGRANTYARRMGAARLEAIRPW
jgi:hypothetical protein